MGHKKRITAPRSKLSPPPTSIESDGNLISSDSATRETESEGKNSDALSSSHASIKAEFERALTSLRRGNHTKALRLMKELCANHENSPNSALVHRLHGTVCVKVATILDDPNAKQRHLRYAVETARKAVALAPTSIEFAHFYANLLYEAATDGKEYEEVVQECEKALAIENPVDPGRESLQEESQQKLPTAEARVGHVQNELHTLIQKANIASISTWMKSLGNGEEKFRLIPIRRATEDPMELRLVQTRRPNEIKKVTKTPEERRKEIEVRVAAARLLQQKSESGKLENGVDKGSDISSGSGQRSVERRKGASARKNASSTERRDWVRSYWNSMSSDIKRDLLKIRISDLRAHLSLHKDSLANEMLSEVLSLAEVNKSWVLWSCCCCSERFADSESHMHHAVQQHMETLMPKFQSVLPQHIENEWVEMLLNCSWKPLDGIAALKMLENQAKSKSPDFLDDCCSGREADDSKEGFHDSCSNEDGWEIMWSSCNDNTSESKEYGKTSELEWMDCDENPGHSKVCCVPDNWPLSEDSDRANLLEKIHSIFDALIKNKYLASSHLRKVMQLTIEELQGLAYGSRLLNYNVDQSPLCICFLGASELKKILKYLQEISHFCGLGRYPEKSNDMDDADSDNKNAKSAEKKVLSNDGSCIFFDENFLACKLASNSSLDATSNDSTKNAPSNTDYRTDVLLDSDAILSWIFTGPSVSEELASWMGVKDERAQEGREILRLLEKEFNELQALCGRKCDTLTYIEALQSLQDICSEEYRKREHVVEFEHRSYEAVLKNRHNAIAASDNDSTVTDNRYEAEAIASVLKDAEMRSITRFGFEDAYGGATPHLCDREACDDDDWRTKDYLHQVDFNVEAAINEQKEKLSVELTRIDARIMRIIAGMQQLEFKLDAVCACDYQLVLVPLVKSFMQAHLEELAEKDATKKSDAVRDALLAELALDSVKGTGISSDNSRHFHEKMKDKKKNKECRKLKAIGGNEQHMLQETAEEMSLLNVHDGEDPAEQTALAEDEDILHQQEDEYRRRIELEDEERKLEETLNYQRRIENEAKLKHLAEQHNKDAKIGPDKIPATILSDAFFIDKDDNKAANEQLKDSNKERLIQKEAFPSISGGFLKGIADFTAQGTDLSTGVIPENGVLVPDRCSGRRSRRQKGVTKGGNGKYQPVAPEKENGQLRSLGHSNDDTNREDNGSKTLRQRQVEDVDEERFHADLEKAVQQSLDTFHARQKLSVALASEKIVSRGVGDSLVPSGEFTIEQVNGMNVYGARLKNEVGEYNCFLNVIIQSLWHLRRFRDEFMKRSSAEHVHAGDPCVICALHDIFTSLSMATDTQEEAVAPTSLRIALSNLYPDSSFFQEGQMNDASEVLGVIFDCLHRSFTSALSVSDTESLDSGSTGSWDCANSTCIAHSLFGLDIFEQMNCQSCGLESRHLKYTSFFHNINASALRTMKVMCPESSFDELLYLVEMNHQLACDPESGGCGKANYIHHILSASPHVFTTVLGWQNTCESIDDITATLEALSTEINVGVLYRGLYPENRHSLISVVCYYGQHYHCFAYNRGYDRWVMYDDKTVKVIGGWDDVVTMCQRGHLQPQVLFFEAVN